MSDIRKIRIHARMLAAAALFCSTEPNRHYLHGVRIEPVKKGVLAIATDGHRLVVLHDEEGYANRAAICPVPGFMRDICSRERRHELEARYCYFNGDFMYATDKGFPDRHDKSQFSCWLDQRTEGIIAAAHEPEIEAEYPDWRRVWPEKQESGMNTGGIFNVKYIADYWRALKTLNRDSAPHVNFRTGAMIDRLGCAQLVITAPIPGGTFSGVLMPVMTDRSMREMALNPWDSGD